MFLNFLLQKNVLVCTCFLFLWFLSRLWDNPLRASSNRLTLLHCRWWNWKGWMSRLDEQGEVNIWCGTISRPHIEQGLFSVHLNWDKCWWTWSHFIKCSVAGVRTLLEGICCLSSNQTELSNVIKENWTLTRRQRSRNFFSQRVSLIKMILRLFMFHLRHFDSTRKETLMCRKPWPGLRIRSSCWNKMIQEPLGFHKNKTSFLRDKLCATWIVSVLIELTKCQLCE